MNKRIIIILALLLTPVCAHSADTWNTGVPAVAHQLSNDIPKMQENFTYLYKRSPSSAVSICHMGTTLDTALTALGSDNRTVIIDCSTTISSDATFPSNLNVYISKGGKIVCSSTAVDLTFSGFVSGEPEHVFYGCGNVTIANSLEIYPEWWGPVNDGTSDDSAAVQAAIDAAPDTGGRVKLSDKDWTFNATINKTSFTLEGSWTGQHGLAYDAEHPPAWRPYTKTSPVLRTYSDRYDVATGVIPYFTSAHIKNFLMWGSNFDTDKWAYSDRSQKGLHIDQGSKGIYLSNFQIQSFTEYQIRIGKPVTHEIMDINASNFMIACGSGGYGFGGLGNGLQSEYGDSPLGGHNWTTMISFSDGFFYQASPTLLAWDNGTSYYDDSTHGTHVVVETSDNPSDNGTWGYIYRCTKSGTSGATEPTWNHTIGGTTSDGSVVWTTHQRGRLLSLDGVGVNLSNVGVEGMHYGGVRLFQDGTPYGSNINCSNTNISGEGTASTVMIENEMNSYPYSYSIYGNIPYYSGGYKAKDIKSYDPAYNYASQTYTLSNFNSFSGYRPTFLDGFRVQVFEVGYNPLSSNYTDFYKDTTLKTTMIATYDDNITLYTPYKIKLEGASVSLPDTNSVWAITKTLSSGTFDANTTMERETITLYATTATTLTNINLETDSNKIEDWNGTRGIGYYETFTSTGPDITSAIETSTYGDAMTNYFTTSAGKNYRIAVAMTLNSGEEPYLYAYSGDSATIESGFPVRLSNGTNSAAYTASKSGVAAYLFVKNLGASNWAATFTLHEHKLGIEKVLVAGDDNLTIQHNAALISLKGAMNLPLATGDMIGLLSVGGIWKETFRNVAADGTYTVPAKLGISYLWADENGTIRRKATAPTTSGDGVSIE